MTTTEDLEVRALVLARALQGRMVRAANGLYEAAVEAADLCERRVKDQPGADDAGEWQDRATYWRRSADRALAVVTDWESDTSRR